MRAVGALLATIGIVVSSNTWAQQDSAQPPVKVNIQYRHIWATRWLDDAIHKSFSEPPFRLSNTISPDTLVITVPDGISYKNTETETDFQFIAVFAKNGNKIGESDESCNSHKISDCTDQLVSDSISANNASSQPGWSSPQ